MRLVGYGLDAKNYQAVASKKKQNGFLENKYAAPFGGVVEQSCKAMGNVPGPEKIWEVLDKGESWGQCDFFVEGNEYSASAKRTIEGMRRAKDLWFRQACLRNGSRRRIQRETTLRDTPSDYEGASRSAG